MRILFFLFLSLIILFPATDLSGIINSSVPVAGNPGKQDTIGKQILYNGRLWRNLYYRVRGDQFLFTDDLLPGTVTIDGRLFRNVMMSYDILKDELLAINDRNMVIQLNKEKIDEFSFNYNDRIYRFRKLEGDSLNNLAGYVNVLADGNVSLLVKYKKEIVMTAVENTYDQFNQLQRIYLMKDGITYLIKGKKDLIKQLSDQKLQVSYFISTSKLKISRKDPDSFVPVMEFYNSLKK